jgi:hypothetical protein
MGKTVELDVREDLKKKLEPFQKIMAAIQPLAQGDVFILHAPFKPVPLFPIMKNPSSTVTRQTKCLSSLDTKGTRGIWAYVGRVSRCEDECLESSEEAPALEPQRIEPVWPSVRFVDKGHRFLKKNVQA